MPLSLAMDNKEFDSGGDGSGGGGRGCIDKILRKHISPKIKRKVWKL